MEDSDDFHGYSDADYTGTDKTEWKSISGYVFFFIRGVVLSTARHQKTIALSSIESEIFALTKAAREAE